MMMKILNFGSLNIDYVYKVDHIVQPGETIESESLDLYCGGKGLNQTVALARAKANIYHAGLVGPDGQILIDTCHEAGADVHLIRKISKRSGNAIIQVDQNGQNSIVLYGGANRENSIEHINEVFKEFSADDFLLIQNEINGLPEIINKAYSLGMKIVFNPSPCTRDLLSLPLEKISIFILNEIEGNQLTGELIPEKILQKLMINYPNSEIVLTLGKKGAIYKNISDQYYHGIYDVAVIDSTAAGDTFTGYFLAEISRGETPSHALGIASKAASIAVSKKGASTSIPFKDEVYKWKGNLLVNE